MTKAELIARIETLTAELETVTDAKRITFLKATINRYSKLAGRK